MRFVRAGHYKYDEIEVSGWARLLKQPQIRRIHFAAQVWAVMFGVLFLRGRILEMQIMFAAGSEPTLGDLLLAIGAMLLVTVVILAVSCPVHELLHFIAVPGGLSSERNIIACKWGWLPTGAIYEGAVSRNREVLILLSPLVVITLLCFLCAALVLDRSPWSYVIWFWGMNLVLSSSDIIVALLLLRLHPKTQIFGNYTKLPPIT